MTNTILFGAVIHLIVQPIRNKFGEDIGL